MVCVWYVILLGYRLPLYLDSVPRQRGSIVDPLSTPYMDNDTTRFLVSGSVELLPHPMLSWRHNIGSSYNTPRGSPSDEGSLTHGHSYDTPPQSNDIVINDVTLNGLSLTGDVSQSRADGALTGEAPPYRLSTYLDVPKLDRTTTRSTPLLESSQSSHAHTIIANGRSVFSASVDNVRGCSFSQEEVLSKSLPLYSNRPRPPDLELMHDGMDVSDYYTPLAQPGQLVSQLLTVM